MHLTLSLTNFQYLFTDELYGLSYLFSMRTAFFSTLVCLAARLSDGLRDRAHLQGRPRTSCCS